MATEPVRQILVVDDDARLGEMVTSYLTLHGFAVTHVLTGEAALELLRTRGFCAIILDVMLPGQDGLAICRIIRDEWNIPTIMLTALGDETDRVVGLETGADDYLGKPFSARELLARLRAVLRRSSRLPTAAQDGLLTFGALVLDPTARTARNDGRLCELTSHQFSILLILATRVGRVQSREQLMHATGQDDVVVDDRTIDVHISRIRAEVEPNPKAPTLIRTIRGLGYVLTPPEKETPP